MTLYFITGSKNKLAEVQAILPEVEQMEIDLDEIQELDAHKIITAKLLAAGAHHDGTFIVEDTSLYFKALNGLPGPLIKWFMKTVGNEGLYKIAKSFGNYSVEAKTIIGYADEKGNMEFFEGTVKGKIVEPRGDTNFGWDPIFQPEGYEKTFAELSAEEKNSISMRRTAVEKLKAHLTK